jgi:endonuclease YncB( thermonuclease family)
MQRITQIWRSGAAGKIVLLVLSLVIFVILLYTFVYVFAICGIPIALIAAIVLYFSSRARSRVLQNRHLQRLPGFREDNPRKMMWATVAYLMPLWILALFILPVLDITEETTEIVKEPTPTIQVVVRIQATPIVMSSPTPYPTYTPFPTFTPVPTYTPYPTPFPSPTSTPQLLIAKPALKPSPASTKLPPTLTPTTAAVVARVIQVIDGDTIEVEVGGKRYRVRYIGVDTPEQGDPYFEEATEANRRLVEGQTIRLERDVSEIDRFGRLLRYVYVGNIFVNAELVKQGYARVATFPPDVKYQGLFLRLEREAREAERGLWAPLPDAVVTADRLNLRSGPGTQYDILGTIVQGSPLEVIGRNPDGSWLVVVTEDGTIGWVFAGLVQLNINLEDAPPALIPATPTPVVIPTTPPSPPTANCDPSYPDVCIPPPPPDLDCKDIPYRNFRVVGADPHRFDGNNDGIGCER